MENSQIQQAVWDLREGKNQNEASRIIYDATRQTTRAVIAKYCKNKNEHEDILQETYIVVFLKIGQLQDVSKLQAWINRIAANTAIRYCERLHPERYVDITDENGDMPDLVDDSGRYEPGQFIETEAQCDALREAMEGLSEGQRNALWLVYGDGTKIKEAAETLGISENTMKSRLFQGRKKLEGQKNVFRKYGVEVTAVPIVLLIAATYRRDVYAAELPLQAAAGLSASKSALEKNAVKSAADSKSAIAGKAKAEAAKAAAAKVGTVGATKAAGVGIGVKVAAGVVAATVVIGGGAFAYSKSVSQNTTQTAAATTMEETVSAEIQSSDSMEAGSVVPAKPDDYITLYESRINNEEGGEDYTFEYEYTFSSDGKIVQVTKPSSYRFGTGIVGYTINRYDEHEQLSETIYMDIDEGVSSKYYSHVYDSDGHRVESLVQSDGEQYNIAYKYNDEGQLRYEFNGELNREYLYEWDSNGHCIKDTTKYLDQPDDMLVVVTEYQYDENNTVISYTDTQTRIDDGETKNIKTHSYEYSYDETGMWRKRIGYTDGTIKNIFVAVSQQYLFENPDAAVPTEFNFETTRVNLGMTLEEVEATVDNESLSDNELLSDNENETRSDMPDVYIGEDSSLKHITINNIEVRLPMSVPDFLATGLELNGGRDFVEEDKYVIFDTPVDGGTLGILVVNPYHGLLEEQADVMDCYVAGVYYESSNCSGEGFRTGNGLTGKNPKGTVGEILGPGGSEYGYLYWNISEGDKTHRIQYSYFDTTSSEPTDVFILFATFEDKSEATNDATEVYISDDGQTITIDRILSEVTIHGYSEEGEFTISDYVFWMEGDDDNARRQIYNSSGEYNGYQDYLFADGTLIVETYDANYNYIGSFQDGEYTLISE